METRMAILTDFRLRSVIVKDFLKGIHSDFPKDSRMVILKLMEINLGFRSDSRSETHWHSEIMKDSHLETRSDSQTGFQMPMVIMKDSRTGFPKGFQMETHLVILTLTVTMKVILTDSQTDFRLLMDLMTATRLVILMVTRMLMD